MSRTRSKVEDFHSAYVDGLSTPKVGAGARVFRPGLLLLIAALLLLATPQVGHAQDAQPAKPTGFAAMAGDNSATLTWDDPSDDSITG